MVPPGRQERQRKEEEKRQKEEEDGREAARGEMGDFPIEMALIYPFLGSW